MRALRLFVVVLTLVLAAAGCGGGGGGGEPAAGGDAGTEPAEGGPSSDVRAAMVTDVGGLGDQSFNDSAFAGLEEARDELGVAIEVLESSSPTDYVTNLTQLAESGFSPVFGIGFLMTDAITEVAAQFPDTNFAIVDSVVEADNVASLVFEEQQGSYLAGVVAGLMTQEETEFTTPDDQIVGFLGGLESDLIIKFEAGYRAGVESVCPDCEVLVQYAGSTPEAFNDPARGQEISLQMIGQGADIIYHASGGTGAGLFEAAQRENVFAIGVDSNQAELVPEAPILTSMIKRVDVAVRDTVEAAVNGEFPGGEVIAYGLEDEGVGLAPFGRFSDLVPQEVTDAVDQAREAIISGEVDVPSTREELGG